MKFGLLAFVSVLVLGSTISAPAATHKRRTHVVAKTVSKRSTKHGIVGQRTIDDERATQIQSALIKAGYLSGEPSGHWDTESQAAMEKLQSDNGWQTKLVPDSRALIKLGLGPSTDQTAEPASLSSAAYVRPQSDTLSREN